MKVLVPLAALALLSTLTSPASLAGEVYAVDGSSQMIMLFDAATGTLLDQMPTPTTASGNADGLAAASSSLFFVNANGSNVIHEIDAATGTNINSFAAPSEGGGTDGLAVVGGFLYSLEPGAATDTIYRMDPDTGAVLDSCSTGQQAAGGLAGEGDRLFALLGLVQIVELDPADCSVINGPFGAPEAFFGLAFDGTYLYGSGAQNQLIYTLDPADGQVLDSFDPGFVASGLASTVEVPGGEELEVSIDIKPGSCKNPFNTGSRGVLPVVLHGSLDLDVAMIDTETVTILGVPPLRWAWGDEGGAGDCENPIPDGHLDAVLKFSTPALVHALESRPEFVGHGADVVLQLEGATTGGTPFSGEDTVHVMSPSGKGRGESARGGRSAPASGSNAEGSGRSRLKRRPAR